MLISNTPVHVGGLDSFFTSHSPGHNGSGEASVSPYAVLHKDKNFGVTVYKTKSVLHLKPTQFVFAWKIKVMPRFLQSTGEYSFVD